MPEATNNQRTHLEAAHTSFIFNSYRREHSALPAVSYRKTKVYLAWLADLRTRACHHRYHASTALSCAPSMTGSTTIWFMPDVRASVAAIELSALRCSLIAGMPVAQAPPIEPSPLPMLFPA